MTSLKTGEKNEFPIAALGKDEARFFFTYLAGPELLFTYPLKGHASSLLACGGTGFLDNLQTKPRDKFRINVSNVRCFFAIG